MAWTDITTPTGGTAISTTNFGGPVVANFAVVKSHGHTGAAGDGALIAGVAYTVSARLQDEFLIGTATSGDIGDLRWISTLDASAAVTYQTSIADHPGFIRLSTAATSNNAARITTPGTTTFSVLLPAEDFDARFLVRLNTNDANTRVRIGFYGSNADQPTDGIYVEKLPADTQWFGVTRASSSETRSTALASTSTSWVTLRIRRIDASTIGFTADSGTERTNTANIPTAGLNPTVFIETTTTADKTLDVDFVRVDITGLSR